MCGGRSTFMQARRLRIGLRWALMSAALALGAGSLAQAQGLSAERQLVVEAADAMGGVEQLQAVSTLTLRGYGQEAYQEGGSKITTEATAPEKFTNLTAYERVIDLVNDRTRVRARAYRQFVFAAEAMMRGQPREQSLDGHIAYDGARRQSEEVAMRRRMELLANPLVALRAALDPRSTLSGRRYEGPSSLVDVTTAEGAEFTLAVSDDTRLPIWIRWVAPHENLGEVTLRAEFSAYSPVGGLLLPMSFNTVSDFRDTVMLRLHVDRYVVNGDTESLAATEAVRAAPAPTPSYSATAEPVAPSVWLITGTGANSILLEFADHLTLFEVPGNRGWTQAIIDEARRVVPGKPLTQAIISHHHFDHTGGLRTAIAEGLTIITQTGNVDWFEEIARRPVTRFPDALSRNPRPLQTLAVDDHLRLSDDQLTVDVYRMVSNGHMAHGLMAYVPEHRLLIQGDLFDLSWQIYFWGETYEDNLAHRGITVERDVPVHGRVLPIADVRRLIAEQTANARALCDQVEASGLSMPGCPLAWDDWD
jgi:glyoxylase-like metal-dependent hydrolase (beta-lactamase superfamily II)